jgi:hypothetical protein
MNGFLLLPQNLVPGYRSIERTSQFAVEAELSHRPVGPVRSPFEPALIEGEMDLSYMRKKGDNSIWPFFSPGWRRDAYRLYEENMVDDGKWDPILLRSREVAQRIREIIEPHIGPHEIVACEILELSFMPSDEAGEKATFLGYDVAYPPGGDYYSAINNGLFGDEYSYSGRQGPPPELVAEYRLLLNQFGLFPNTKPILAYVRRFKELSPSEADSDFVVYKLGMT